MQNFHNVKLPNFISVYSVGGPCFSTLSSITASGRESRIQERSNALQRYIISGCRLSQQQFNEFNSFFRARFGQQYSFRMRDHSDYELKDQIIAVGDGGNQLSFAIFKSYSDEINPYKRRILKLSNDASINVEGRIDLENGMINLSSPLLRGRSLIINSTFDVTVRFLNDDFKYSLSSDGSILIEDINLMEVL